MGKIISGGLIEENNEAPQEEGLGGYLLRNVAKAPTLAYQTARSGLGAGNLINLLSKATGVPRGIEQYALPTTGEARQEISKVLPTYFTEERPEDYPAEFLVQEAPFLALNYLTGGTAGLLRGALSSVGMFAGGQAGQELGGTIGKSLGNEELGRELGGLPGALIGSAGVQAGLNRPTKYFPDKIYQKNVKQFEANKAQRLAEVENEFLPKIHEKTRAYKQEPLNLIKEKNEFTKSKADSIRNLIEEHKDNRQKIDTTRTEALKHLEETKKGREASIKELETSRHPEYAAAEKAAVNVVKPAPEVEAGLKDISKNLGLGIESSERVRISEMARQIEGMVANGTLTLEQAKATKQNINLALYDKTLPPVVKKYYTDMRNSLNEFITRVGEEVPEHGKPFSAAEQKTIELKKLQRETPEFNKKIKVAEKDINDAYKREVRDVDLSFKQSKEKINESKFPLEKELFNKQSQAHLREELNLTKKDFETARKEIGKETFDKLVRSELQQDKLANTLQGISNKVSEISFGGLGVALTHLFGFTGYEAKALGAIAGYSLRKIGTELNTIKKVFNEHPELLNEYFSVIGDATLRESPKLINRINQLGNEIENYSKEEPKKGRIISGGLKD